MNTDPTPEPNVRQAVPFFAVSSMEASLRYYVDGLGFVMTKKWVESGVLRWCWLELGDAAIMLQEFRREGHDSWKPEGKAGVGVTVYFICRDALAIYHAVKSRGVEATVPFVGNGMWVTTLTDPDGYCLAFESFTDVEEETVYAG